MKFRYLLLTFTLAWAVHPGARAASEDTWKDISNVGVISLIGTALIMPATREDWEGLRQAAFEWMTSLRPDLVIRLNVDLDTAHARKPDHRREALKRKIEITPQLKFGGAPIAEIDASQPLAAVLAAARTAVAQLMEERGYTRS